MNTVSVVIPTYNMLNFLKKAINSVLKQSYKNYEIISLILQNLCNNYINIFRVVDSSSLVISNSFSII